MDVLNPHEPFERLTLWSVGLAVASIFPVDYLVRVFSPELGEALFVPMGAALCLGYLAALSEGKRKRYGHAVLGFVVAIFLFPGLGWFILIVFHIAPEKKLADFIAMIPQGIAAPSFFYFVRKRFHRELG